MKLPVYNSNFDFVVCGAGMPGIVAALGAARLGLKTALINDRGVLGGNAGPEVRIHICGANGTSEFNMYADEGGILGELLIENRHKNPQGNVYLWHDVLLDAVLKEENLTLFLNTYIDTVNLNEEESVILSVEGTQSGSEKRHVISGNMFVDDTGDGTVGYLSGAEFMYGRESSDTWGESIAPNKQDDGVLLSSMSFYSKDFHRNVTYTMPTYAQDIMEEFKAALPTREIPDRIPLDARYDGYRFQWYYETGAGKHQTFDNEQIRLEHAKLVSNIWDRIKNHSDFDANRFDLEYVSPVLGKRESRRIVGEYILKQQDIALQNDYDDCIGHGGWSIDLHSAGGFYAGDLINKHYYLRGVYKLPYRVCVSRDIKNLFLASRSASFSHVALGTARVMGTLCMLGQASGMAAVLCKKYGISPSEVGEKYISELQQMLQQGDQFVFEKKNENPLLKNAEIIAESNFDGCLSHTDRYKKLTNTFGVSLPTEKNTESFNFFAISDADCEISYSVFASTKKENYGPEKLLFKSSVPIKKNEKQSFSVYLNDECRTLERIFISFEKNEAISIEVTEDRINGYIAFEMSKNIDDTYFDILTLETKKHLWLLCNELPVVNMKSTVYSAKNIINGYIRNYGNPNLWMSNDDSPQSISLSFSSPVSIGGIALTFDSLSENLRYDNLETYYELNICDTIVKEYEIFVVESGRERMICSISDNYKKVNRHIFDATQCDSIRIYFKKTNGSKRFALYDFDFI